MTLIETIGVWMTIGGSTVALLALAWSAVNYVIIRRREQDFQDYKKLFELMDELGREGHSVASKMAAAYELRKYPQYRDVIIRLFEKVEVGGDSAKMLKDEMALTAEHLRKHS